MGDGRPGCAYPAFVIIVALIICSSEALGGYSFEMKEDTE